MDKFYIVTSEQEAKDVITSINTLAQPLFTDGITKYLTYAKPLTNGRYGICIYLGENNEFYNCYTFEQINNSIELTEQDLIIN